jgi:hypothetical protein
MDNAKRCSESIYHQKDLVLLLDFASIRVYAGRRSLGINSSFAQPSHLLIPGRIFTHAAR